MMVVLYVVSFVCINDFRQTKVGTRQEAEQVDYRDALKTKV